MMRFHQLQVQGCQRGTRILLGVKGAIVLGIIRELAKASMLLKG